MQQFIANIQETPREKDWIKSKVWCLYRQKIILLFANQSLTYL